MEELNKLQGVQPKRNWRRHAGASSGSSPPPHQHDAGYVVWCADCERAWYVDGAATGASRAVV